MKRVHKQLELCSEIIWEMKIVSLRQKESTNRNLNTSKKAPSINTKHGGLHGTGTSLIALLKYSHKQELVPFSENPEQNWLRNLFVKSISENNLLTFKETSSAKWSFTLIFSGQKEQFFQRQAMFEILSAKKFSPKPKPHPARNWYNCHWHS